MESDFGVMRRIWLGRGGMPVMGRYTCKPWEEGLTTGWMIRLSIMLVLASM